jgi:hypothetical protein
LGDDWWWELEHLRVKYNKPHWLRYISGHFPPGPTEKKKKRRGFNVRNNAL